MGKASKRKESPIGEVLAGGDRHPEALPPPDELQRGNALQGIAPKTAAFLVLSILVVCFIVYFNALYNEFVYDDMTQVLENQWISDVRYLPDIFLKNVWSFLGENAVTNYYRPLMHVIYMMNYQVFGLAPWGFHLVNVLFHAGVSILILLMASKLLAGPTSDPASWSSPGIRMTGALSAPFVAAMLFAVHPIHTEAVAWVGGLPDVSFTFFYLLSFYFYMLSVNKKQIYSWQYLLSIVSFSLAVLCKEPALTLPAILIVYDYAVRKDKVLSFHFRKYLPYFIVIAGYFVLRVHALGGFAPARSHKYLSTYQYIINVFPLFCQYLEKLLLPINLNAFYVLHPISSFFDVKGAVALVVTAAFLFLALISLRNYRTVFLSLSLIIVPLLPVLYIPWVGDNTFAERYLYLPSVGFVLLVSFWVPRIKILTQKTVVASLFLIVIASLYCVGTITRNFVWKDNYSLFSDAVKKSPDGVFVRNELGRCFRKQGRLDEAIEQYEIAIRLDPQLAWTHDNLGEAYYGKGWTEKAVDQYMLALKRDPAYANTYYNLGSFYWNSGLRSQAIECYERALALRPSKALYLTTLATANYILGATESASGQIDDAIGHFKAAVELQPDDATYRYMLGITYGKKGLYDVAIEQLERAVRLAPGNIEYRQHLEMARMLRNSANAPLRR